MSDTPQPDDAPISIAPIDDATTTISRLRRSVYCFGSTIITLFGIILLGKVGTGPVAEHAVDGLSTISEVVAFSYLGVSTLDRSGLLAHIGMRLKNGPATAGAA